MTALNSRPERFTNKQHHCGISNEIVQAHDTNTQRSVLLRQNVSPSQKQRAIETSKLKHSVMPHLNEVYSDKGMSTLVYECPHPKMVAVAVEKRYLVSEVVNLVESFHGFLQFLEMYRHTLEKLEMDDFLIDEKSGVPLLINHDNIIPLPAQISGRAEADIARIAMQMSLGSAYEVVRGNVELRDRQYTLSRIPSGVDVAVTNSIKKLFVSYQSPQSPQSPQPSQAIIRSQHIARQRRTTALARRIRPYAAIICVAMLIGTPTYLHFDHKAKLEALAEQERKRIENDRIAAENRKRKVREACLAAIQHSKTGDCRGQDLTSIDATGKDLRGIQLDGANLSDAILEGANLRGMEFTEVDLSNANLRSADLSSTTPTDVQWDGADLMNASLEGAYLQSADFSGAELGEVDLDNADISHANLSGVNLSNQKLVGLKAVKTKFQNALLSGVTFSGGEFNQADFDGADLTSSLFVDGAFIDESSFSGTTLAAAQFRGAVVHSSTFSQANLQGVIIEGAEFGGVSFLSSNLRNSQFRNSSIVGGNFTGSNLSDAVGQNTSFRTMDFEDTTLSSVEFVDCDFYRASFFNPGWFSTLRNVVMPDGAIKNPTSSTQKD